jgi:hypothetical protein
MSGKKSNFLWPTVDTIESAKKASMYGFWAAAFSATITTLVATWALGAREKAFGFVDAWGYVDAVIFAAIAYGIYKEKRFAVVFGLAFFLFEKAVQIASTGTLVGAWMAIILTLCYVVSIRGIYALRKLRKINNDQPSVSADGNGS